jgi:multiple sugar transport system permease protein
MIVTFLAPAIIIFCLIFLYPIIRTTVMSFFDVESVSGSISTWKFIGIDNFTKLANTALFRTSMWNLFRIWLYGGVAVLALALLFAVILNSGIKAKKFYRAAIYMPNVISAVALAAMWMQYVFNVKYGLLTTFFTSIGWESLAQVQWTDAAHKFGAMLVAYCFGMVGYHMLIFSSGIEKIPKDYFEASRIDGAGHIRQFMHITWPLLRGVLKTNITMWSITSVCFFIWSQLFSAVTVDNQTITPMVYLYLQTFGAGNSVTERNAGLGAAVGVIMGVIVVLVFIGVNKLIKNDDVEL